MNWYRSKMGDVQEHLEMLDDYDTLTDEELRFLKPRLINGREREHGNRWWVDHVNRWLTIRSLGHSPTKAPCVPSLSLGVARQLASLGQGERATAGSDEGTHSRQCLSQGDREFRCDTCWWKAGPFRSLTIYRERGTVPHQS